MSWKFQLLGIEVNNCPPEKSCQKSDTCVSTGTKKETSKGGKPRKMAKKTKKVTNQRKKFTKAVQSCHKSTTGRKSFGRCMSKKLKK